MSARTPIESPHRVGILLSFLTRIISNVHVSGGPLPFRLMKEVIYQFLLLQIFFISIAFMAAVCLKKLEFTSKMFEIEGFPYGFPHEKRSPPGDTDHGDFQRLHLEVPGCVRFTYKAFWGECDLARRFLTLK